MPKPTTFLTVPSELQPIAHACLNHLRDAGYKTKCEYSAGHFPETATILATRGREHHFYIFDGRIKKDRLSLWAGYGRSCSSDTFIILCVPVSCACTASAPMRQNLGGE